MKLLTNYENNRTRVGVMTIRRHESVRPGIKSLTSCQGKQTWPKWGKDNQKVPGWTRYEITYCLSSQANRIREGIRTVRKHSNRPGIISHTNCSKNKNSKEVKTIRRHIARPGGIKFLTCYKVKPTEPHWKWGQSEDAQLNLGWNHSLLAVKPSGPKW